MEGEKGQEDFPDLCLDGTEKGIMFFLFYFCSVLGFEPSAYTLSHSTNSFL
jgi:hypothetical protein